MAGEGASGEQAVLHYAQEGVLSLPSWPWFPPGFCLPGWPPQVEILSVKMGRPSAMVFGAGTGDPPSLPVLDTLVGGAGLDGGHGRASLG